MVDAGEGWFFTGLRLHRVTAGFGEALCGEARPDDVEIIGRTAMRALLGSEGRSGCARCDRALEALLYADKLIAEKAPLSPEQRQIRDRLDAEQKRREEIRASAQPSERSTSVRHIAAGLPTLGKRRR